MRTPGTSATSHDFDPAPLAPLACMFALGVLLARFVPFVVLAWCVPGVAATACACLFVIRRSGRAGAACLLLAAACAGATLAQVERTDIDFSRVRRLLDEGVLERGTPAEVTGVIEGAPEPLPDGFALDLRAERLRFDDAEREASGRIRLFAAVADRSSLAAYEKLELRAGARVRVMTVLRRDEAFRNPGVDSRVETLDRRGYDASATIKSPRLVERLDDERVVLPAWWLARRRAQLIARAHELFEPHTAGLLGALLLGDAGFVTRDAGDAFRAGGTYHVLVISGMHVTIVGLIAASVVNLFTRRRVWRFVVPAVAVWAFAVAVGAETSVVRAAIMFTLVLAGASLGRRANPANALGAAALLLLAWQPSALFEPSFQLTFLSVFAVACVAAPLLDRLKAAGEWRPSAETPYPPRAPLWWRRLGETLYWDERLWRAEMERASLTYELRKSPLAARLGRWHLQSLVRYVFAGVVVSACVQIVMLPCAAVLFHRVTPAALLLGVPVGAALALVTLCALAAFALAGVSTALAAPFVALTETLNWFTIRLADPLPAAGLLSFRLPAYEGAPASVYALYYVPLILLLVLLARWQVPPRTPEAGAPPRLSRLAPACVALALLALLVLLHPFSSGAGGGRLRVDFLDVGQGDAALVTLPGGTTLLIDGGGRRATGGADDAGDAPEYDRRSIGEAVVSEYLWWRGLDRIDYLIATHADADHIEGLSAVARNFRVRAALVGRVEARDPDFARLAQTLAARGVPLQTLAAGDVLSFGGAEADGDRGARLEVLNPPTGNSARSANDDSVVLRLAYGGRNFLFTGDIEAAAEARLARAHGERLRADVVKVAHHGSRTSSAPEFVQALQAQLAVVSVGQDSPYGHPNAEVVARWQASGARVLTTGACGTIEVSTDGDDLRLETYVATCVGDTDKISESRQLYR